MAFIQEKLFESGFNLGAPIFVQGGANGKFAISANQIAWGTESTFNGSKFGNTTADLLTAIENSLKNNELKHFTTLALANAFLVAENTTAAEGQIITVGTGEDIVIYLIKSKKENDKTVLFLEEAGSATKVLSSTTEIDAFCTSKNVGKQFFVESDIKNGETLVYGAGMYVVTADKTSVKLSTASDIARLDEQVSDIDTRLTYFLSDTAALEGKIDTLKEIAYWLDNDLEDAAYLTVSLAGLTTYTYNVVAAQADTAYNIAYGAYGRADDAYDYADNAYKLAQSAYDLAYWAGVDGEESYTYTVEVVAPVADYAKGRADSAYQKAGEAYNWAKTAYTYTHNLATVDVIPHITNSVIHVTVGDKQNWNAAADKSHTHDNKPVLDGISADDISKWNAAAEDIAYFLNDTAELEGKIDTLKEIAYWLDNDLEDAAYLTVSLAELTAYTYAVADDAISRISVLESKDHDVQISYNVTSSDTTTGYFISSVDVVRTENTNDYTLKYTYAYVPSPKADDYWAEYEIANTFSGYVGVSSKIKFVDVYGTTNAYSVNITKSEASALPYIFSIEANNVEATTYFYFVVNGKRIDAGTAIGDVLYVYPNDYDGTSYAKIEGSITSNTFTGASLSIDLYDEGTNKVLTSMTIEINVVADPT